MPARFTTIATVVTVDLEYFINVLTYLLSYYCQSIIIVTVIVMMHTGDVPNTTRLARKCETVASDIQTGARGVAIINV